MRIALVISSLEAGGAQRVLTLLANIWVSSGRQITIITLSGEAETPFFRLDQNVERMALDLVKTSRNAVEGLIANIRRLVHLRRAIQKAEPDIVISFIETINVLTLVATIGLRVPVVVSERIDPHAWRVGRVWNILRRLSYRRASAIVVQTKRAGAFFRGRLARRVVVIPNPVVGWQAMEQRCSQREMSTSILAIGRLEGQKGFDLLISAFVPVRMQHAEWKLVIVGEGPERGQLERQIAALGLGNSVELAGSVRDPGVFLQGTALFVLSSRVEGFPNVLCEAMAAGVPVVSFDCPSGPSEIIRDGVDGLLVPPGDVNALSRAIDKLISDEATRIRLGQRAIEIRERFRLEKIVGMWDKVLEVAKES